MENSKALKEKGEKSLLKVENVSKVFGGLWAVKNYNLHLPARSIYGLIGPNGAGKTTIFNLITGVLKVTEGNIIFKDVDITDWRPDQRARIGVTRSFQNLRLFKSLSVIQNVKIARHMHLKYRLPEAIFNFPRFLSEEKKLDNFCEEILSMFELSEFRNKLAMELPYGLQRKLDIVRAIFTGAELILLDEPTAGMNLFEASKLAVLLKEVWKKYRLTMVIVEHRMPFILGLAEHIQVLDHGETIAEGSPREIRKNPRVIEAYLGKEEDVA